MRFVPSFPPVTANPATRDLRASAGTKAVKPVAPEEGGVPYVTQRMERQHQAVPPVARQDQRAKPSEDRRKECRRLGLQPFLVELRSGIERRRRSLREGDMVDHIDEEA